jgi:hypothetical protein
MSSKLLTALTLIHARELAKALEKTVSQVATQPVTEVAVPRSLQEIWSPDSGLVKVPAGSTKTVYLFRLNDSSRCGVVLRRAWTYYESDELTFLVDGLKQYDQPIRWALGEYPNTTESCLIPFSDRVEVQVKNGSSEDHWYGVMCRGYVADSRDKSLLIKLAMSGAL